MRAVIFTPSRDWHARKLLAAFACRNIEARIATLEECVFDSSSPHGLRIGKFSGLPDAALVRSISAGSFEAVTRRLGILHALKALGVLVWNDATAIERCVDKSMTTFLLGRAGLAVPQSWAVEGIEAAAILVKRECAGGPLVLKPLFGSQGRGLRLVRSADDLPSAREMGDVYYLQRFVGGAGPEFRDFRIFVVEGEAVAAMRRDGKIWITNVKQGGQPVGIPLDDELTRTAVAAARCVGASFCGVDILRAAEGTPYVLEVNSMPAWSGLQAVTTVDIADTLAERFLRALPVSGGRKVA
jgi:RimK family alpha-L-glutamate ligase